MIKDVMFYQAQCDACGALDDGGEFSAWSAADDARMMAVEADWTEIEVKVSTTTPRGSNIYLVTRDGQEPFLQRSILICPSHAEGHHRGWCSTCEEDLDDAGWVFSFAPNGGEAIVQRCRNGHPNVIDLASESHVSEEGDRMTGQETPRADVLIAALRRDAGDYRRHMTGDHEPGEILSWDQSHVRAWQAADALEAATGGQHTPTSTPPSERTNDELRLA